jgi:hypothetical protein
MNNMAMVLKFTGKILLITAVMTVVLLPGAMVLRYVAPSLSIPHLLHQYRYGLLAWRLCLYAAITVLWTRSYRCAGAEQRPALKRIMGWFLLLVMLNETSNSLQPGGGV